MSAVTTPTHWARSLRTGLLALALAQGIALAADDDLTERGKWVKQNYGSLSLKHYDAKTLGSGYSPGAMSVKGGKNPPRSSRAYAYNHRVSRSYAYRGVRHYRR